MLHFFRKYEKYIFIVITVVIVISFSFFGTYQTLDRPEYVDKKAFTAVDGSTIKRSEVEEIVRFIGTDSEDKLLFGGAWGPNFLNNGVIKEDFIETGFAQILASQFSSLLKGDWEGKRQRETRYTPYVHPQGNFISVLNAWKMINPDFEEVYTQFKEVQDPLSPDGISARINLFLVARKFPPQMIRQVLRYQERQYSWIPPDPNLNQIDLSLFGYNTIEDWFGPNFTRLVAEYILNSAILAEQKGYKVTKEEALADLLRNAEISFKQNSRNPNLGVVNTAQYFDEQLRRMGMDQNLAVKLWQKVLLFRRLYQSGDAVVLATPETYQPMQSYSLDTINGELYQLPNDLRINDFRTLQKFESYLSAVSNKKEVDQLTLPTTFLSVSEVEKRAPELVQRRYLLDVAKVDKKSLQIKVGIKQTWDWQVADENWEKLKKQFPELGVKKGATPDERYAALNGLDKKTKTKVDSFAREAIVDAHPEWLEAALSQAVKERQIVSIRKKGENPFFPGLKEPDALIALLDRYPSSTEKLSHYTPDNQTYYAIQVVDRSPNWEVVTFTEAFKDGILAKLSETALEKQYEKVREKNPKLFQNSDGSWKLFAQVQQQVAEAYYGPLLEAIKKNYYQDSSSKDIPMINDYIASLRLYSYMNGLRDKFIKNPETIASFIQEKPAEVEVDKLPPAQPLANQWKITQSEYKVERNDSNALVQKDEAFALEKGDWSQLLFRPNGEITFFHLQDKGGKNDPAGLYEITMASHKHLSNEAQMILMSSKLQYMKEKDAISLSYLISEKESEKGME